MLSHSNWNLCFPIDKVYLVFAGTFCFRRVLLPKIPVGFGCSKDILVLLPREKTMLYDVCAAFSTISPLTRQWNDLFHYRNIYLIRFKILVTKSTRTRQSSEKIRNYSTELSCIQKKPNHTKCVYILWNYP